MICILSTTAKARFDERTLNQQGLMSNKLFPELTGWIIALTLNDARFKADAVGEHELADWLGSCTGLVPGRYQPVVPLPEGDSREFLILVTP